MAGPVPAISIHTARLCHPPAMAAGVTKRLWEMKNVVGIIEAWEATN